MFCAFHCIFLHFTFPFVFLFADPAPPYVHPTSILAYFHHPSFISAFFSEEKKNPFRWSMHTVVFEELIALL